MPETLDFSYQFHPSFRVGDTFRNERIVSLGGGKNLRGLWMVKKIELISRAESDYWGHDFYKATFIKLEAP